MATDIFQKLELDFGVNLSNAQEVLAGLDAKTKGLVSPRVVRSIVYLSKGDLESLERLAKLSLVDCRDVLWQAEYDGGEDQLRDFNKTFHELGLLKSKSKR